MTSPTATGPTARSVARRLRWPVALVLALAVLSAISAVIAGRSTAGELDPRSYGEDGARAIAELLRDRGTEVRVVGTIAEVTEDDDAGTTVLVPFPTGLAASELEALADLPGALIVVGGNEQALEALAVAVELGAEVFPEDRQPVCSLPAAQVAGEVEIGGLTYRSTGAADTLGCYPGDGDALLLALPAQRITLIGSADFLTNGELDEPGSAALALGLLGPAEEVRWFLPAPGRDVPDARRPISELVPDGVNDGALALLLAALVLALWRGRRLGRVVEEPLPIVVRAAEAVEGRSRLYRAAGARDRAAEALRGAARETVVRRVRLGHPTAGHPAASRAAVVAAVVERTGRDPVEVDALLYGAPPADDAALVRLADALDALTQTLTREVAGS